MIRLLLGGSPCTHWSIAQKNGRETEPNSGLGWELFLNYKIALEKYKPDYFLYENNKSASQAIKDEIARQFGFPLTYINSALVSAQNRERFYVHNWECPQPEDRGFLLRDVLDGTTDREKARTVLSSIGRTTTREYFIKSQNTMAYEPVLIQYPRGKNNGGAIYDKAPTITSNSWQTNVKAVEPVAVDLQVVGRKRNEDGVFERSWEARTDGKSSCITTVESRRMVAEPLCYATPCEWDENGRPTKAISFADGKTYTVYEVKGGIITIKGKQYPIKLPDGYYIIRKLTVKECKRLQTIPDWYEFPVSDTQAYKMIGNGWTVEVIKHLLSHIPNIQNEEIEVLSMYDGMSCGQIALREMGCNITKYYATEIDKYAIQTTLHNFPNTIQLGDAFQVRDNGWRL